LEFHIDTCFHTEVLDVSEFVEGRTQMI